MRQPLHLVHDDDKQPTRRQAAALTQIEDEHRRNNWHPFAEPKRSPTFDPDAVLSRSLYTVVTTSRTPLWVRFRRYLRTTRNRLLTMLGR